jgi:hypothetical protein
MKRSDLPSPHVITDTMPAAEQVDGRFYESKRARAVGRSWLTEIGNSKLPPKKFTGLPRPALREAFRRAMAEYREGRRPKR